MDETELLKKRLIELHNRSSSRNIHTYSDFLSLAEQSEFLKLRLPDSTLFGGFESAERKIACFGAEGCCGAAPPIVCVKIEPVNKKYSDELTHRDFLGSIMASGIERNVLGDIVIRDNTAWVFCRGNIADFIISSVSRARHTTVKCSLSDAPDFVMDEPPVTEAVIASERLDAIAAGVYALSRSEGKQLVMSGKVYLDGRLCTDPSETIKPGTIVSVRGTGRFKYIGIERETRRGRLRVSVRKY